MFRKPQIPKLFGPARPGYTPTDTQAELREARMSELDLLYRSEVKRLTTLVTKAKGRLSATSKADEKVDKK